MVSQVIGVTEFKAKCLSLLDEISRKGGTITVTKRGQPLVTIEPALKQKRRSSRGILRGKMHLPPDEILMADTSHLWNVLREEDPF